MKQLVKTTLSTALNYLAYNNIIVSIQHKYLLLLLLYHCNNNVKSNNQDTFLKAANPSSS